MNSVTRFLNKIGLWPNEPRPSQDKKLPLEDQVMVDSANWISANTPVSSREHALEDQVLIDAAVWAQARGGGAPLD